MTKSDLTIGLIIEGSISRSDTASLIAAKSTTTGTPVKSCNTTLPGIYGNSLSGTVSLFHLRTCSN